MLSPGLQRLPGLNPLFQSIPDELSSDYRWFMAAAADIERAIAAGFFPPAPGMSCAMCDFTAACAGSRVVAEVDREAAE